MGNDSRMRGSLGIGVAVGFALLIAAVWASGASTATSLAVTGLIVLVAVVGAAAVLAPDRPRDASDEQRERMRKTTP
jgi:hypothetical protein